MAEAFHKRCDDTGIKVTAFFGGFDIPSVKQTVGLMPKATRAERLVEIKEIADFAKLVSVDVLGLHIGFVLQKVGHLVRGVHCKDAKWRPGPALSDGPWSKPRRGDHILKRMAFVRKLFAHSGPQGRNRRC